MNFEQLLKKIIPYCERDFITISGAEEGSFEPSVKIWYSRWSEPEPEIPEHDCTIDIVLEDLMPFDSITDMRKYTIEYNNYDPTEYQFLDVIPLMEFAVKFIELNKKKREQNV